MDKDFLLKIKNLTPVIQELEECNDPSQTILFDADDEMVVIAEYIKKHNQHNEYVEPKRIKYLYSSKPKKDGVFDLIKRSEFDKMINDEFDFILSVFYKAWSKLSPEQKIITLDKALCGIEIPNEENAKAKKKAPDSKEYIANLHFYGAEKVLKTTADINLICASVIEQMKEDKKSKKDANVDLDAVIQNP